MSHRVELHPQAENELSESYQWYEERSEGLGFRFINSINKRLKEIADHPERYPKKKGKYRETGTEIFPYIIIYEILIKENIVFVLYIFHSKRNPLLKYRR